MSIIKEFKEFAVKGNAMDLAVGLIIGTEFGKIVNSMVQDVIMPPLAYLIGNVDYRNIFLTLKAGGLKPPPYTTLDEAKAAGAVTVNVGLFFTTVVSFVIIAFSVFLLVRGMNELRRRGKPAS